MKAKPTIFARSTSQSLRHSPFITFLVLALTPAAWAATETFTAPGTIDWVCPPGISSLTVEARGGGGAGGSATRIGTAGTATSGGGAGGSYARTVITSPANATYKVTVGGGGVSLTTVATNGSLDPGQKGGDSKFTDAAGTVPEIVLATGGVGGTNARVTSNTTITQLGGDGSSVGSIGDVGAIFRGGNGGDAGVNGGGGGGGAGDKANAADLLVTNVKGLGGTDGGGDGSDGRGNGAANNPAAAGSAPGGGGGGVKIQTSNATNRGGAGGAGTVKLTYTFASGLDHFEVVASSPQTAGVAFDVTITAQDVANATVNDSTSVVTMSSPAGSLMEFDWNSDGTYGDNSGTLDELGGGVKTIKARNIKAETKTIVASYYGVSTSTPPSVTTTATAFAKLQILAPGETSAPGTPTGRSGTPNSRFAGTAFNATVNAVDEFWNLVSAVTDSVGITSSDAGAVLPADAPLAGGTGLFAVTLNTVGSFTLTATDLTDGLKSSDTTSPITVASSQLTWDAGNTANGGTIDPANGTWNTTPGNIVWNDTVTNLVWDPTRQAVFGGSDGTYAITVGGTFSAQKILFSNSGYTISGTGGNEITISSGGGSGTQPGIAVVAGESATLGSNLIFTTAATFYIGADNGNSGGTLNVEGAGANLRPGQSASSLVIDGVGTIVNLKTGAILNTRGLGAASTQTGGISVGQLASSDASLNVDGGSVQVIGGANAASFNVGNLGKGTVTLISGSISVFANASNNGVTFGNGAGNVSTNTFNLDGGILATSKVRKGSASSTAIFNFNGGTLTANVDNNADFMTGIDTASVKSSGAKIDTQSFNVTIGQNLLDGTGGGGLTKTGSGALTLTGTNTYTGPTAVDVGTLALVGGSQTSAITVASLAKLGFTLNSPTTSTSGVTLTDGTVAITGTVDNLTSYKLMTATSFTGPFTLATPIPNYALQTQAGNTELWLVFVGSDPFETWAGGPGVNFEDDANNDGVDNGLAWLLGAADKDVSALEKLPVITQTGGDLKLTFDMLPLSERDGAELYLEHSSDLGTWSTGVLVPDATGGTVPVTFIVSDSDLVDPENPLDVEATVSSSEAAAGKLFGRLKAVR